MYWRHRHISITVFAEKLDPRLATVRKAYVVPVDELGDDQIVAVCVADRIRDHTPIEAVKSRDEADVILKIKGHIPGAGARYAFGSMGKTPSAHMYAELPDGTKLWDDGAKKRFGTGGTIGGLRSNSGIACAVADEILDTLREAMRKARAR